MSVFFGKIKRDHSDKLKDGKDSNKVKESKCPSSLPDEIF